jgi:hypothetical protein
LAIELLEDMKILKQKIASFEKVEKTVNMMNFKITYIEGKINNIEARIKETEDFCNFVAKDMDEAREKLNMTTSNPG